MKQLAHHHQSAPQPNAPPARARKPGRGGKTSLWLLGVLPVVILIVIVVVVFGLLFPSKLGRRGVPVSTKDVEEVEKGSIPSQQPSLGPVTSEYERTLKRLRREKQQHHDPEEEDKALNQVVEGSEALWEHFLEPLVQPVAEVFLERRRSESKRLLRAREYYARHTLRMPTAIKACFVALVRHNPQGLQRYHRLLINVRQKLPLMTSRYPFVAFYEPGGDPASIAEELLELEVDYRSGKETYGGSVDPPPPPPPETVGWSENPVANAQDRFSAEQEGTTTTGGKRKHKMRVINIDNVRQLTKEVIAQSRKDMGSLRELLRRFVFPATDDDLIGKRHTNNSSDGAAAAENEPREDEAKKKGRGTALLLKRAMTGLRFAEVKDFGTLPSYVQPESVKRWHYPSHSYYGIGYRHMCRFFGISLYQQEILMGKHHANGAEGHSAGDGGGGGGSNTGFDYYLRLDTDSYILDTPMGYRVSPVRGTKPREEGESSGGVFLTSSYRGEVEEIDLFEVMQNDADITTVSSSNGHFITKKKGVGRKQNSVSRLDDENKRQRQKSAATGVEGNQQQQSESTKEETMVQVLRDRYRHESNPARYMYQMMHPQTIPQFGIGVWEMFDEFVKMENKDKFNHNDPKLAKHRGQVAPQNTSELLTMSSTLPFPRGSLVHYWDNFEILDLSTLRRNKDNLHHNKKEMGAAGASLSMGLIGNWWEQGDGGTSKCRPEPHHQRSIFIAPSKDDEALARSIEVECGSGGLRCVGDEVSRGNAIPVDDGHVAAAGTTTTKGGGDILSDVLRWSKEDFSFLPTVSSSFSSGHGDDEIPKPDEWRRLLTGGSSHSDTPTTSTSSSTPSPGSSGVHRKVAAAVQPTPLAEDIAVFFAATKQRGSREGRLEKAPYDISTKAISATMVAKLFSEKASNLQVEKFARLVLKRIEGSDAQRLRRQNDRADGIARFLDHVDRKGGIFYYRWGDAEIRTLMLSLFFKPDEYVMAQSLGYQHYHNYHCASSAGSGGDRPGDDPHHQGRNQLGLDILEAQAQQFMNRFGAEDTLLGEVQPSHNHMVDDTTGSEPDARTGEGDRRRRVQGEKRVIDHGLTPKLAQAVLEERAKACQVYATKGFPGQKGRGEAPMNPLEHSHMNSVWWQSDRRIV